MQIRAPLDLGLVIRDRRRELKLSQTDLARKVGRVSDAVAATAVRSLFFSSSPAGGDTYERGETIEVRAVFNRSVRVAGARRRWS